MSFIQSRSTERRQGPVFASLTPVFGECYVLPQRFVIFAVKHHLPPKKGGIYIEFLSKAFKRSKFKIPPKKADQRPNPRLPGALSQPYILHLPGTKVGFPPFFGGGDGRNVPYRRVTIGTTCVLCRQGSIGISTCNPLADGSGVAGCISCDGKRLANQGLLSPCLCPTKMIPIATNMGLKSNQTNNGVCYSRITIQYKVKFHLLKKSKIRTLFLTSEPSHQLNSKATTPKVLTTLTSTEFSKFTMHPDFFCGDDLVSWLTIWDGT